jgi:hypothetical protein
MPGGTVLVARQIDEGREPLIQPDNEGTRGYDVRPASVDDAIPGEAKPEFRSTCLGATWLRETMQHRDRAQDGRRSQPQMLRSSLSSSRGFEYPPAEIGERLAAVPSGHTRSIEVCVGAPMFKAEGTWQSARSSAITHLRKQRHSGAGSWRITAGLAVALSRPLPMLQLSDGPPAATTSTGIGRSPSKTLSFFGHA